MADLGTGEVLAAKSAHRRLPPASTQKMLTALALLPASTSSSGAQAGLAPDDFRAYAGTVRSTFPSKSETFEISNQNRLLRGYSGLLDWGFVHHERGRPVGPHGSGSGPGSRTP